MWVRFINIETDIPFMSFVASSVLRIGEKVEFTGDENTYRIVDIMNHFGTPYDMANIYVVVDNEWKNKLGE